MPLLPPSSFRQRSHTEAYRTIYQCSGSGSQCFWASWIRIPYSEVWIRIRILLWIRILLSLCKNSEKNLDSYYFVTHFDFLSLKTDVNVASKSNKQKKLCTKISFLLASWRSMMKIAGSGSISQRHGSADPDPPLKCHGSAALLFTIHFRTFYDEYSFFLALFSTFHR